MFQSTLLVITQWVMSFLITSLALGFREAVFLISLQVYGD